MVGPKVIVDEVERNGEHLHGAKLYSDPGYIVWVVMLVLFWYIPPLQVRRALKRSILIILQAEKLKKLVFF